MKFYKPDYSEVTPRIYLSGQYMNDEKIESSWLKRTKCKYRCFSFAYTCPDAFLYSARMAKALELDRDRGCRIMMDSGAHTFHKMMMASSGKVSASKKRSYVDVDKLRDETLEAYAKYVKDNYKNWDFWINFDFVRHAPTVYKMQTRLEKLLGMSPVPVFHGDDGLYWLEKYCDEGHKLISVGIHNKMSRDWKTREGYLDKVFNVAEKHNVGLHGLAVTSLSLMFRFPWYSVDSTTWIKVAAYGKILYVDPRLNILGQVHISDRATSHPASYNRMPKSVQKAMRAEVEKYGFDFDKMRKDIYERCAYNGYLFSTQVQLLKSEVAKGKIRWESLV